MHGLGLASKSRQLIQADQRHNGAFFYSSAKQSGNDIGLRKDTIARAREANKLDAILFAHPGISRDQNLLHLSIAHLIFVELLNALGMHAGGIERNRLIMVGF